MYLKTVFKVFKKSKEKKKLHSQIFNSLKEILRNTNYIPKSHPNGCSEALDQNLISTGPKAPNNNFATRQSPCPLG